jgi:hypothetical protein
VAVEAAPLVAAANMANLTTPTVRLVVKLDLAMVALAAWMMTAMDLVADLVELMIRLMDQIRDLVGSDLDLTTSALEIKMIPMDPEVVDRVEDDIMDASNLAMI